MKKLTVSNILACPADFLYLFASEDKFIKLLTPERAEKILYKKRCQEQIVNNVAKENDLTEVELAKQISAKMVEIYGLTPAQILVKLANGEAVAGKDWANGIYGVGATYSEGFTGSSSGYVVDKTTGRIKDASGSDVSGQTAIYSGSGKITGYTVATDGVTYTSRKYGSAYYAGTYTTEAGTMNANGSAYTPQSVASIFESLFASSGFLSQFMQWIASLFSISLIRPNQVCTSQADWQNGSDKDNSSTLILFAAGAGLLYLLSK